MNSLFVQIIVSIPGFCIMVLFLREVVLFVFHGIGRTIEVVQHVCQRREREEIK